MTQIKLKMKTIKLSDNTKVALGLISLFLTLPLLTGILLLILLK